MATCIVSIDCTLTVLSLFILLLQPSIEILLPNWAQGSASVFRISYCSLQTLYLVKAFGLLFNSYHTHRGIP